MSEHAVTEPRPDSDRAHAGGDPEVSDALVAQAREAPERPPVRYAEVDERRLLNPSRMLRSRNLLTRLLSWLFFRKVAFDERHARTIRAEAREGEVVYVMNHQSLLDYLYFNWAFLKLGLPLAFFVPKLTMTPFLPLWRMVLHGLRRMVGYYRPRLEPTERLAFALERGHAALLFLKKRSIWPWAVEKHDDVWLSRVIDSQRERVRACALRGGRPRPIRLIPQLLVWTPNPKRYRSSFWNSVFGNPEAPSRFRKLLNFMINRRRAFVQVGRPIDLVAFVEQYPPDAPTEDLARDLRFTIHQALSLEERVFQGPILKRARRLREEILETPRMREAIAALAEKTGASEKAVTKEISGYLKEMSADFSMKYVEFACIMLTVLFSKLYSEIVIDQPGLERVRDAARKAPLVLLPCHRSHVDYLVISYLFYVNGLIPPHIAAGKNLNFFPIGKLFRRSGAFFIRRSFRGNEPYEAAFREYLRKLVKEGYWIEFFIEGGRSRTGKMLPPRFGMLKQIVDAVRSGASDDVQFVPIYVGYEHVIEEQSYKRELSGAEKKKENITALLNATQVLWSKYGRLYVNFGEPISCREQLDRLGFGAEEHAAKEARFLHSIGYQVLGGINDVAVVTPSALAATALLAHGKRGIGRAELLARVGFLLEIASFKKARLSKTVAHALRIHRQEIAVARTVYRDDEVAAEVETDEVDDAQEPVEAAPEGVGAHPPALSEESPVAVAMGLAVADAIDEYMAQLVKGQSVEAYDFEDGKVYALVPDKRIDLDFYKNNIVHLFVPEAILAAAIRATEEGGFTTMRRVTEAAAFLTQTFRYEFVFDPEKGFGADFGDTLARLEAGGLIRRAPGEDFASVRIIVTPEGRDTVALLHRVLAPWVEAYWLLATALEGHEDAPVTEKELVKASQAMGQKRFHVGDITCLEAASSVNFKHALDAYERFGMLSRQRKLRDKLITVTPPGDDDDRTTFSELATRLRDYFA